MRFRVLMLVAICGIMLPAVSGAQELHLTEGAHTTINKPEAYRAYYGKLEGEPHVYTVHSDDEFRLSLIMLAPFVDDARTDFSATVIDPKQSEPIAVLDGTMSEWTPFFDTSGRDDYLAGPPLRGGMTAGEYEIRVSNSDNQGAYVLVIGEDGILPSGVLSRYTALPIIKSEYFGKPSYEAFLTPLLLRPIIAALIVLAVIVFGAYIRQRRRGHIRIA